MGLRPAARFSDAAAATAQPDSSSMIGFCCDHLDVYIVFFVDDVIFVRLFLLLLAPLERSVDNFC